MEGIQGKVMVYVSLTDLETIIDDKIRKIQPTEFVEYKEASRMLAINKDKETKTLNSIKHQVLKAGFNVYGQGKRVLFKRSDLESMVDVII